MFVQMFVIFMQMTVNGQSINVIYLNKHEKPIRDRLRDQ